MKNLSFLRVILPVILGIITLICCGACLGITWVQDSIIRPDVRWVVYLMVALGFYVTGMYFYLAWINYKQDVALYKRLEEEYEDYLVSCAEDELNPYE